MEESSFDYLKYLKEVDQLENRDKKNNELVGFIDRLQTAKSLHDANKKKLLKFFESEWDHQFLACAALREAGNKRRHDWSKDYYFIYVLAGKIEFQIKDADFESKWKEEDERQCSLEPHLQLHKKKGGKITDLEIEEMAIDRLCRLAERHEGEINMEELKKSYPEFQENAEEKFIKYMQMRVESVKTLYRLYVKPKNPKSLIPTTE